MKINIGSLNEAKISAVKDAIAEYPLLIAASLNPVEVSSGIVAQPLSLEETIKGAMNRAKSAFRDCDYSVGIEDGISKVPNAKSDYMNFCVCAIYDGEEFHIGLASAFEYPKEMIRLVLEENMDITEAANHLGFTKNPRLGSAEGMIGILTRGRITRKDYAKQAVQMALIHLENSNLFRRLS